MKRYAKVTVQFDVDIEVEGRHLVAIEAKIKEYAMGLANAVHLTAVKETGSEPIVTYRTEMEQVDA